MIDRINNVHNLAILYTFPYAILLSIAIMTLKRINLYIIYNPFTFIYSTIDFELFLLSLSGILYVFAKKEFYFKKNEKTTTKIFLVSFLIFSIIFEKRNATFFQSFSSIFFFIFQLFFLTKTFQKSLNFEFFEYTKINGLFPFIEIHANSILEKSYKNTKKIFKRIFLFLVIFQIFVFLFFNAFLNFNFLLSFFLQKIILQFFYFLFTNFLELFYIFNSSTFAKENSSSNYNACNKGSTINKSACGNILAHDFVVHHFLYFNSLQNKNLLHTKNYLNFVTNFLKFEVENLKKFLENEKKNYCAKIPGNKKIKKIGFFERFFCGFFIENNKMKKICVKIYFLLCQIKEINDFCNDKKMCFLISNQKLVLCEIIEKMKNINERFDCSLDLEMLSKIIDEM